MYICTNSCKIMRPLFVFEKKVSYVNKIFIQLVVNYFWCKFKLHNEMIDAC